MKMLIIFRPFVWLLKKMVAAHSGTVPTVEPVTDEPAAEEPQRLY
jgi:hypothetical protein